MIEDSQEKARVLFVGAFARPESGALGGQLYACQSLVSSTLGSRVNFELIDSTMESLPPPSLGRRALLASRRLAGVFYRLSFRRVDTIFIFTGGGFGFVEKGLMALFAALRGVRVVLSPRSGYLLDQIENSRLMRWWVTLVFKNCDTVMCQGVAWKSYFAEVTGVRDNKFVVVKNWLNTSIYLPSTSRCDQSPRVRVLFLGWLEKNKGIFDLLHAVKASQDLQRACLFTICGQGSEYEKVKEFLNDNKLDHCFDLRGWIIGQEKIAALVQSDILVLPSYREGLPNSLLEAMAAECAIIATNVGAIPDVIQADNNGILINPGDSKGLTDELVRLANDPSERRRLATNARHAVTLNHDINMIWPQVLDLLAPN